MRIVQNTTLQGFDVPFLTSNGLINIYVKAGSKISVPDGYESNVLDHLLKRRMFKIIKKIVDFVPVQNLNNNVGSNLVSLEASKVTSKKTINSN
jgi:hypothetical protein